MRALAAFSIVAYHASFAAKAPGAEYIRHLDIGVSIFFVLSAFLIYRPFVRARLQDRSFPSVSRYAWRRLLRIVPAYWVALTIGALLLSQREVFGTDGPLYYGFLQIYWSPTVLGGLAIAWTLCVEVALYAFLPVWALFMRRFRNRSEGSMLRIELLAALGLIAVSVLYKATYVAASQHTETGLVFTKALPSYLDMFALGMGLAALSVWYERRPLGRPLRVVDRLPALSWVVAGVAFWALATQVAIPDGPFARLNRVQLLERHGLHAAFAMFLLLPCMFGLQTRGVLRKVLAFRPLLYIGSVSYGVYLWHPLVLHYMQDWKVARTLSKAFQVNGWATYLVAGGLATVVVAALSWRLVERPALARKDAPWQPAPRGWPSPRSRLVAASWGAAMALAGAVGVGYQFLDTVLIAGGAALIAVAIPVFGYLAPRLPVAVGVAAAIAAVAAVVPLAMEPLDRATSVAEAASTEAAAPKSSLGPRAHVVATYDRHKLRIYVNGAERASRSASGRIDRGNRISEIGAFAGSAAWSGVIDDVAVYDSPLSGDTIADHYRRGTAAGPTYAAAVRGTEGLIAYWRLGESGREARDSAGKSAGRVRRGVIRRYNGLITGDPDRSTIFDGRHGEFQITGVPQVRDTFAVEAWVQPGRTISNRSIAGRIDSWFLKTDALGRWSAGFLRNGKIIAVSTKEGARPPEPKAAPAPTPQKTPNSAPAPSVPAADDGSGSSLALLALLAAVGLTVAALPSWRRRQQGEDSETEDAPPPEPDPPSASTNGYHSPDRERDEAQH